MEFPELLAALSQPTAYPNPDSVEVIQTHISAIFLVGPFVYKIRKPVKFPFLDFSSLDKRLIDCQREVELNQRLARDVYLDVVPITVQAGQIRVEASGDVVEWAVKMRRLPDNATLEQRLLRNEIDLPIIRRLAQRLAEFHTQGHYESQMGQYCHFEAIARAIRDNFAVVHEGDQSLVQPTVLARLQEFTLRQLEADRPLIELRACHQVARDTHGDLRLEHVYLLNQPPPNDLCVIDCIEFNDAFRYIDPIADIAFLVMDLKFHGRSDLARVLADEYLQATGDVEGGRLLPLYTAYRAMVRAKVETLELSEPEIPVAERQAAAERARAHWILALSELSPPAQCPCLILIGGLQGTGKSTLARGLSGVAGLTVIRTDVVRKELAGIPSTTPGSKSQLDLYAEAWTDRTYDECLRRAEGLLAQGQRVVIDGTFSREKYRRQFLDAATRFGVAGLCLICQTNPEVVHARLDQRHGDASDADWGVYQRAVSKWEEPGTDTSRVTSIINTSDSMESGVKEAVASLRNVGLAE